MKRTWQPVAPLHLVLGASHSIYMIRSFKDTEADRLADVWLRSGLDEYVYVPGFQALDANEALQIFQTVIMPKCEIWVEEFGKTIRGFVALDGSYIDRLYVDPAYQGVGVGTALIDHAKSLHPGGLELHTHQQNLRAKRFYERLGFRVVEYGISPPPESLPDVKYRWP